MSLVEHLEKAARHLKEAAQLAADWRVKEAAVNAATTVNCGIYLQKQITAGELKAETSAVAGDSQDTDSANQHR
jgi:hypothetical protein